VAIGIRPPETGTVAAISGVARVDGAGGVALGEGAGATCDALLSVAIGNEVEGSASRAVEVHAPTTNASATTIRARLTRPSMADPAAFAPRRDR
jgi:hypothetical protein